MNRIFMVTILMTIMGLVGAVESAQAVGGGGVSECTCSTGACSSRVTCVGRGCSCWYFEPDCCSCACDGGRLPIQQVPRVPGNLGHFGSSEFRSIFKEIGLTVDLTSFPGELLKEFRGKPLFAMLDTAVSDWIIFISKDKVLSALPASSFPDTLPTSPSHSWRVGLKNYSAFSFAVQLAAIDGPVILETSPSAFLSTMITGELQWDPNNPAAGIEQFQALGITASRDNFVWHLSVAQ